MDATGAKPPVLGGDDARGIFPRHAWLVGGLSMATAAWALFLFDPAQHSFYPRCVFHWATGLDCPGCGGLRAAHALLHGEFAAAWAFNPIVTVMPVLMLAWLGFRTFHLSVPRWWQRQWLGVLIALLVGFGIGRNLPESTLPNPTSTDEARPAPSSP